MNLALEKIEVNGRHRKDLGDIRALANSIKQVGLLHPVVVTPERRLVAGERRLAAAQLLGWKDIPATIVDNLDDAYLLIMAERDENVCRKEFAPSEAVAVGRVLESLMRPVAKQRQREHGGTAPGRKKNTSGKLPEVSVPTPTRDAVAADVGMSGRTYEKAKAVTEAATAEPEKFAPLVAEMDRTGKVDKAYRKLNERKSAERPVPPLPTGTYDLILADPPWSYDCAETESRHLGNQYQTATIETICAQKPPSAETAVLFLWATAPKLPEALQVMQAWGFSYRTHAIWDKEKIGMGYWFRGQHELLLVGTKGDASPPTQERRVSSVIRSPRGRHSEKPDKVYEILESMFPRAARLEMYARQAREGWSRWGNEA